MISSFQNFSEIAFGSIRERFTKQLADLQNEIFDSQDFKHLLNIMQYISNAKNPSLQNQQDDASKIHNEINKTSKIPSPMSVRFAYPDLEENKEENAPELIEPNPIFPEKRIFTSVKERKPTPYPKSNSSIINHLQQFPIGLKNSTNLFNVEEGNISQRDENQNLVSGNEGLRVSFAETNNFSKNDNGTFISSKVFPEREIQPQSCLHPENSVINDNITNPVYSKDSKPKENENYINQLSEPFYENKNRKELRLNNDSESLLVPDKNVKEKKEDDNLTESGNLQSIVQDEPIKNNCINENIIVSNEEMRRFQQDNSEYDLTLQDKSNPSYTYEQLNDKEFDESNFKMIEQFEEIKDTETGEIVKKLVKRLATSKDKILPHWASEIKNLYKFVIFQKKIDYKSIFGNLYPGEIDNLKNSVFQNVKIVRGTSEFNQNSEDPLDNNNRELQKINEKDFQILEQNEIPNENVVKMNDRQISSEIDPKLNPNISSNSSEKLYKNNLVIIQESNLHKDIESSHDNENKYPNNLQFSSNQASEISCISSFDPKSLTYKFERNENGQNNFLETLDDQNVCIKNLNSGIISSTSLQMNPSLKKNPQIEEQNSYIPSNQSIVEKNI